MPKILIVEDEKNIVRLLRAYLEREGYEVQEAADGEEALKIFGQEKFDLVLLDLMLPKMPGFEVCRRLREKSTVPILMLTARVEESDKVLGLELGADDYIVKPFNPREVVARVRANLRRAHEYLMHKGEKVLKYDEVSIDPDSHTVKVKGRNVEFTPAEFRILYFLASQPGKVFRREQLLAQIGEESLFENYERTIDTHIKNIRKKLGDNPKNAKFIKTVWGIGYKFEGEAGE